MNDEATQTVKDEEGEKRGSKISNIKKSLYERIKEQGRTPAELAIAKEIDKDISPDRIKENKACIKRRLSEAENKLWNRELDRLHLKPYPVRKSVEKNTDSPEKAGSGEKDSQTKVTEIQTTSTETTEEPTSIDESKSHAKLSPWPDRFYSSSVSTHSTSKVYQSILSTEIHFPHAEPLTKFLTQSITKPLPQPPTDSPQHRGLKPLPPSPLSGEFRPPTVQRTSWMSSPMDPEETTETTNTKETSPSTSPLTLGKTKRSSSFVCPSAVKLVGLPTLTPKYNELDSPSPSTNQTASVKQRKYIVDELINTEQSYIKSLTILVDYFLSPLEKLESDCMYSHNGELMLTIDERDILFSNTKRLMLINLRFFSSLQRAYKEWDTHESIGYVFIKYFIPKLDAYDHYAVNYSSCLALFYELMKRPSIKKVLESLWEKSKYSINDFGSFIITPIQRLPRYMLLLRALIKYTPSTHRDYNDLNAALDTLVRAIETINSRVENIEGLNQYIVLQRKIIFDYKSKISTIMKSARRFIKECSLEIFINEVRHDSDHIVLFNDSIGIFIKKRKNYIFQGLIHFKNADIVKIDCFHSLKMFSIFVACKCLVPECLIQLIFPDVETRDRWFEDMCQYDQKIPAGQDAFVNFNYRLLPMESPKAVKFSQEVMPRDSPPSPRMEQPILSKMPSSRRMSLRNLGFIKKK